MPIRVDAYITGGMASGVLARAGYLREVLDSTPSLDLERATWQSLDDPAPRPSGDLSIAVDDVLVAVGDDDPSIPVHAAWHEIVLDVGPYRVLGEMPTMPGFDPGRALTRPTGEFVLLRDVRIGLLGDARPPVPVAAHALINRYGVEKVQADLMLGFFFPGAAIDDPEAAPA